MYRMTQKQVALAEILAKTLMTAVEVNNGEVEMTEAEGKSLDTCAALLESKLPGAFLKAKEAGILYGLKPEAEREGADIFTVAMTHLLAAADIFVMEQRDLTVLPELLVYVLTNYTKLVKAELFKDKTPEEIANLQGAAVVLRDKMRKESMH